MIEDRIIELIEEGHSMAFEMAPILNLSQPATTKYLANMCKAGKIVRQFRGVYALPVRKEKWQSKIMSFFNQRIL